MAIKLQFQIVLLLFQDKLFPYVKDNIKAYVKKHYDNEEFQADLKSLREQVGTIWASIELKYVKDFGHLVICT